MLPYGVKGLCIKTEKNIQEKPNIKINKMENIDKMIVGYDFKTQTKIRELLKYTKFQLVLQILNLEKNKERDAHRFNERYRCS